MSSVFTRKTKSGLLFGRVLSTVALMFMFLFTGLPSMWAQTRMVTGTVTDGLGKPLPGVSVVVTTSATGGVLTDRNGKFAIGVGANDILRFTYVGMSTQEITVGDKTVIDVMMSEEFMQLDDVIVVGYGTQRVRDLTGAATSVSVAQIPDIPAASLVDALAGQVVGLSVSKSDGRPGSTGSFKVREPVQFGNSSAYNQPLIVIDGVIQVDFKGEPTMTTFNMLDRSEIENMTVLKDASAAVYGRLASSGVILVETKRGTSGQAKISYSGRVDYADAVGHAKYMNAYELGVFTNRMIEQKYWNTRPAGEDLRGFKYSEQELERMKGINYDWLDHAWQSALTHRHSLTVDGGSPMATYFAGISYQDQGNNLGKTQDYSKWTFRAGGNIQVAAGLKLTASVSGYTDKQVKSRAQGAGDYSRLINMPKYIPWEWEIDGENHFVSPWMGPIGINTSVDGNLGSGSYATANYFANDASKARDTNDDNGWNANFQLRYEVPFIKGLTLTATYSRSHSNTTSIEVGDYYQIARADNTNEAGKHLLGDYTTWSFLNFGDPNGTDVSKKPKVQYKKTAGQSEQINFQVNYGRTFGKHDVSATGVIERAETFGNETVMQYQGVDVSYNGSSKTAGVLNAAGSSFVPYESGALSYVGRMNYKYDDRYLFQFVIRTDASTKFAPENYWGTFPTASVGWVVSNESFFKNSKLSDIFQFLKVRYSLGKTGKDNILPWTWMTTYNISGTTGYGFGSTYGGLPVNGAQLAGTPNRNVKWDETIKQNIGLDFSVLSNRLSITTDYYYDKTSSMLLAYLLDEDPIYIGAPVPMTNYGKMDAWGWEFSARWSDQISQSLLPTWGAIRYGIGVDYGISWRKVTRGSNPVFDYPATMDNDTGATGWHSPGSYWGFLTWKNTSQGDGMLRTQEDIDNYWNYLSEHATASGTTPSYFGVTSKDDMKLGMLAYQDLAGSKNADNTAIEGPDGRLHSSTDRAQDYTKLANNRRHTINSRFNLSWGNFHWSTQLTTSWGGFTSMYTKAEQGIGRSDFINSHLIYLNDMFHPGTDPSDPYANPNGKYPSWAVGNYGEDSDFWRVSSFRMYVRNMTFGYSLPTKWLEKINVDKVQLNITGNNLWDFYNPYPKKFRNMYDAPGVSYPTLRTWTFGLNVTF